MTASVEKIGRPAAADPAGVMATGGDERIALDPATGLNRYHSAPRPSGVLAYASSTANDISAAAFAYVAARLAELGDAPSPSAYAAALEALRGRIRRAYGVAADTAVAFAPSGTDLEYVALACAAGRAPGGTHNILLGADEVGSGCIHSAHGRYFGATTALGHPTRPGAPVPGMDGVLVDLVDIPVRDAEGRVRRSAEIAARMEERIAAAAAARRHVLVHVVHGSKTGLILPLPAELDRLQARHEGRITLVVDACQARITGEAVRDYLARGAIVFVTGSKFMGAPPFSGFALAPPPAAPVAAAPAGLATLFRRAEWPRGWPGADALPDTANAGLLLRLEAAAFELERFQRLDPGDATRVILAFHAAVRTEIIGRTPARRVAPYPPGEREEADTHPVEMRTLSTLDLTRYGAGPSTGSGQAGGATFEQAQAWHKALIGHGVRLGQPVKCVRLADGAWGATLRIGLTMAQVVERAPLSGAALERGFAEDMARIRKALAAVAP